MWVPLRCTESSAPAFAASVEAVTIELFSADELQSTKQTDIECIVQKEIIE